MDPRYVSPCEKIVGACYDANKGEFHNLGLTIPEVWAQIAVVLLVMTFVALVLFYGTKFVLWATRS